MQRSLRGLALRGAFGALMIGAGLMGAPAFAASGHGHEHGGNTPALNGHAKLDHTPTGKASLVWDKTSGLTANLSLTGLTPGGTYTANIKQGSCDKGGTALYAPTNVTVNADGTGTGQITGTTTTGIPHHGWYVAVNQGNTMVACGNVRDVHHEGDKGHLGRHIGKAHTQQSGTEHASAKLGPTKDANQHVGGEAHLHIKNGTLTLTVHAHGLTSGTTYPVTLNQGSCSALSNTAVYPAATLKPLTQTADGDWTSTTTGLSGTTIPDGKWYVAIWSSTTPNDMLACGNVKVSDHGNHD